ncbi:inositol monophosphatase [Candidatus Woesearchaeota archaeon]|nr:inositol monophosphatase [Candidatus Woesearchaeota archaeon]
MKQFILKLSKDAGKLLMKHYGKIKSINEKDNESYFTNVDLASEKLILGRIKKKFPSHNVVSEESSPIDNKSEYTWYIDPIDGTHNYIREFPLFGVSIAIAYKGEVIMGTINLPCFKEIYFAEKNKGVYCNGKKISVSKTSKLSKAFVVTDLTLRYDKASKLNVLKKLKWKVYDMRAVGCAVYSYVMVAKGIADVYYTTQTNSWDVAAGALIVSEAGGNVTDFTGEKWNPNQGKYISTNKQLHNQFLKVVKN